MSRLYIEKESFQPLRYSANIAMETQCGREAKQEDHNSKAKPVLQNRSDASLGYTVRMKGLWVKRTERKW